MNPNLAEVSKATQWKPGQSGNLNGRPIGSRTAFSQSFHRDLAEVWADNGKASMLYTAEKQPAVFFATCARLIGPEVKLTIEQSLPGNAVASRLCDEAKPAQILISPRNESQKRCEGRAGR